MTWRQQAAANRMQVSLKNSQAASQSIHFRVPIQEQKLPFEALWVHKVVSIHSSHIVAMGFGSDLIQASGQAAALAV